MGDFRAQVAAVKTGERRFLEMIDKYGRDAVVGGIEAIMQHSEAATRARVREIPDGVYEAESFMDDDGVRLGERVPIRVRVEIAGDRMKVDLTDVAKQVAGFYNSGETAGRSCCQVAFKCLTSPLDLPINDGQFRALEIVLPPGRVVSALKPAAMRMWMTYPMTIIDTIFKARTRAPRAHHRRPPRGSRRRTRQWAPAAGGQLLHLSRRFDRRRLGRQAQPRRLQRHHRDERRRYP
jgi:N-methylhydantoinase B